MKFAVAISLERGFLRPFSRTRLRWRAARHHDWNAGTLRGAGHGPSAQSAEAAVRIFRARYVRIGRG
jgi:hypothetical protein